MACQHSLRTRDVDPMPVQFWANICNADSASNQHWFNVSCLMIAAGLVVLTAGGDYKPTPTQCLLNVGPASLVLASIYSALVSNSCWREHVHFQRGAQLQTAKYLLFSQVCILLWGVTFPDMLALIIFHFNQ